MSEIKAGEAGRLHPRSMKLALFGATGRIGEPLLRLALQRGHLVSAYARHPAGLAGFRDPHLTIVSGGLEDRQTILQTVKGADAVLVTLAAGKGLLARFDANLLPILQSAGPRRVVSMVGAAVAMPGDPETLTLKLMTALMRLIPNGLLGDAEGHARRLAASGLQWTLVRSANFSDRSPGDPIRAEPGFAMPFSASVACADLAAVMLDAVEADRFIGQSPMVCNG